MENEGERNRELISNYLSQARYFMKQANHGKAFAFYLLILKLVPTLKLPLKEEFCEAWHEWSKVLMVLGKYQELMDLYNQGCEIFPDCDELHLTMGTCYYSLGHRFGAHQMYKRTLAVNPNSLCALESLDNLCSEMIDNWHFPMLNDIHRNTMFRGAIQDSVNTMGRNGLNEVLDIGSGTGILSMFAACCGASHVTSCELCPVMSEIGKQIIEGNGFGDKITSQNCMSTNLKVGNSSSESGTELIPCKASLVVTETLDAGAFGEGIIKAIDHAWKNLLVPVQEGGSVIPASVLIKCTCIESEILRRRHCLENNWISEALPGVQIISGVGIQMQPEHEKGNSSKHNTNDIIKCTLEPYTSERMQNVRHRKVSDYHTLTIIDFNNPRQIHNISENQGGTIVQEIPILSNGFVDAIVTCFELAVDRNIPAKYVIDTEIGSQSCWEQAVYPVRNLCGNGQRISVLEGDLLSVEFFQKHDKLVLASCTIKRKASEETCFFSQILSENSTLRELYIALKEEEIVCNNEASYWNACYNAFLKWYKIKTSRHSGRFTSSDRSLQGSAQSCPSAEKNDHLHDRAQSMNSDQTNNYTDGCNMHSDKELLHIQEATTGFSSYGLRIAANFPGVSVLKSLHDTETENMLNFLAHRLKLTNVLFSPDVERKEKFDAIFLNPVDPSSGLLQQNVLKNILAMRSSLKSNGKIFPSSFTIMCMLVESQELLKHCAVVSNENTLGLEIGKFMNEYQVKTRSHFDMNKMEHKALTDPFPAMIFDFNQDNISFKSNTKESVVQAKQSGKVNGAVIWYNIQIDEDHRFDSSNPENCWLQSAVVFPPSNAFVANEEKPIKLTMHCSNGFIAVRLEKAKDE